MKTLVICTITVATGIAAFLFWRFLDPSPVPPMTFGEFNGFAPTISSNAPLADITATSYKVGMGGYRRNVYVWQDKIDPTITCRALDFSISAFDNTFASIAFWRTNE